MYAPLDGPPPGPVDVMLLDIRMPGKSGLEVMEEIKPDIPVVAMTGNVDRDSIEEYR